MTHHNHPHPRSLWRRAATSAHLGHPHGSAISPLGVSIGWLGGFLVGTTVGIIAGMSVAIGRPATPPVHTPIASTTPSP